MDDGPTKQQRKGRTLNVRRSSSNEMVAYCYNNSYLQVKPMLRKPNCLIQRIWKRPLTILMWIEYLVKEDCKHKISQLQKIKQLKRNMVCKYKFVLMTNEYNLYFNSFTKEYPLILSSLNLTRTRDLLDFGWKMEWTVFTTNL